MSAIPAGHALSGDTVALPPAPRVAVAPFTVSLVTTFGMGVPGVPATAVPASALTMIDAATVIVSVVFAQSAGVLRSQSWY